MHGVSGLPDEVHVQDDGVELPLEERLYSARGYLPPVEELLWQEDYFGVNEAAERVKTTREAAKRAAH